jgi:hypothetical protein
MRPLVSAQLDPASEDIWRALLGPIAGAIGRAIHDPVSPTGVQKEADNFFARPWLLSISGSGANR